MDGRCGEGTPDEAEPPEGYCPREDEAFTGPRRRAYFRRKLLRRRRDVLAGRRETIVHLRKNGAPEPDIADRTPVESARPVEPVHRCAGTPRTLGEGLPRRLTGRCRLQDSNLRPSHYECDALPTELRRRAVATLGAPAAARKPPIRFGHMRERGPI